MFKVKPKPEPTPCELGGHDFSHGGTRCRVCSKTREEIEREKA